MNFKAFAADHRTQLIVGVVAAGAGLVALKRKAGSASGAGSATSTTTAAGGTVPAGGYASDPYNAAQDAYNSLEPQLANLQQQLASVTAGSASPRPAAPAPAKPAPKPAARGPQYSLVSGPEADAIRKSGGTLYYDPYVKAGAGNVGIGSVVKAWKPGVSYVNLYKKNY